MTIIDLTKLAAPLLSARDREILQAFVDCKPIPAIADEQGLPVTAVRDALWALCRLQDRIACHVLAAAKRLDPEPPDDNDAEPPALRTAVIDQDLADAGVTYRKLDYWIRLGYIHTEGDPTPGSGHVRTWTTHEREIARTMARLTAAGLSLPVAAAVARGQAEIGPGIRIVIDDRAEAPT